MSNASNGSFQPLGPDISENATGHRPDICKLDVAMHVSVLAGYSFCATLQLRTPLRVLKHDGVVHIGFAQLPPQFAREQWEGIWLLKTKTWKELGGVDFPEFAPSTRASDIGPVSTDGRYLEFLVTVRSIVEVAAPVESRRAALLGELGRPEWADFVAAHGKMARVLAGFFPRFVDCLLLPPSAAATLWSLELRTASRLQAVSDHELLAVKGIGPARLRTIRRRCAQAATPNAEYADCVTR